MEIVDFAFDSALAESFARFGGDHYRDGAGRFLPSGEQVLSQLSSEFAFYRTPGNRHRHFLCFEGKEALGRVSATLNRGLRDKDGVPVGAIGFFECVEDASVAHRLLEAAVGWLRGRGIRRVWGPMNFDIWHGYRWMTRGFEQSPLLGEPRNKPYYPGFIERFGFSPRQEWISLEIRGRAALESLIRRGRSHHEDLLARGYRFEPLGGESFGAELRKLHPILTRSFEGFLGFTPIPLDEFERLFAPLRGAVHPRCSAFAYDESGVLAGFSGGYLDLAGAARLGGRSDRILYYAGGITREESRRASGLGRAGLYHIVRSMLDEGYETVVFALMEKGGKASALLRQNAKDAQREYALYELNL